MFVLRTNDDNDKIYPVIWCDNDDSEVEHRVQIYYNLLNNSKKNTKNYEMTNKAVLPFDEVSEGFYIPVLEILVLKNGWLNGDGVLSYEYGIQVKGIYEDSIWTFNFNDKLFKAGAEQVQFKRKEDPNTVGPLYSHKLLLHFHSDKLARLRNRILVWDDETWRESIIDLLQLCHGVRRHLTQKNYASILIHAEGLQMFNVVSYSDWLFVHKQTWENMKGIEKRWIFFCDQVQFKTFIDCSDEIDDVIEGSYE
ncbi:hypothetical protein CAEBREN_10197 [Caenorhabditis brenneri]|uniref:Uncharacterized protein n=1 Tax=Caenorhabditis brenneri TaxID=135651 RepID=G0NIT2_CAEBE|nr:hypothetical protein CAEBREN_10197 [Caenorhabditis brenneri]